ncbi:MAG: carbohydrate porin [Chroococcidiopsidaceae cyanobacterium CP_BM_RX_35]|nr:carbohydrate porin [Chroococcidiopsidaceae cyanobacterium CP_BM_RX_35]
MLKSFHHLLWFSPTLLGIIFVFANPATATVSEYRISQAVSEVSPSASNRSVAELDPSSADLSQPSSEHANPMVQFLPISQSPNASSGNALQQQSVEPTAEPMEQVTSVSQLSDVQPTDWAFQALQSLVERYGCIAGYPDKTFRGNRALTRYEFAAGLNACLERINELLSAGTADLVRKEDVTVLRRLQAEFTTELTALRGRVDTLEVQTAKLESQQFSTTTKLLGNAIFGLADAFGKDGGRSHTAFQYRANLNFASSFTGRDLLLLSLFAGDAPLIDPFRLPGITAEGTLSSQFAANTNNQVQLLTTDYTFPVGEKVRVHVLSSLAPFQLFTPTLNPYLDDKDSGTGAIGVFGEYNPIYTLVGGGTGVGLNYQISPSVQLSAGYLADGLLAGNPNPGAGLFNGGYGALGQLTWKVTKRFPTVNFPVIRLTEWRTTIAAIAH